MYALKAVIAATVAAVYLLTALSVHAQQQPAIGGTSLRLVGVVSLDRFNRPTIMGARFDEPSNVLEPKDDEEGCYYHQNYGKKYIVCLRMASNTGTDLPPDGGTPAPRTWRPDPAALTYLQRLRRVEDTPILKKNADKLQKWLDDCEKKPSKTYRACDNYNYWSTRYTKRWQDYPQERNLMRPAEVACEKSESDTSEACLFKQGLVQLYDDCYNLDYYRSRITPTPCTRYKNEATSELSNLYTRLYLTPDYPPQTDLMDELFGYCDTVDSYFLRDRQRYWDIDNECRSALRTVLTLYNECSQNQINCARYRSEGTRLTREWKTQVAAL